MNTLRASLPLILAVLATAALVRPATAVTDEEFQTMKQQIAELQSKLDQNWMTQERASQIRAIVDQALADAKARSQSADGPDIGYNNGFYIKSPDNNFKLVINGYTQVRYEYALQNATNGRSFSSRTVASSKTTPSDPGNASSFDIRRARVSFQGNAFSPNITYKLEGDFYGGSGGAFTVTDAFIGYRFTDQFKLRAGSFKVPFAKAELTSDPFLTFQERPEELAPFDPVRAIGASLYGDIVRDKVNYEVNINDGGNTNTLKGADTVSGSPNFDNRLAYYGRVQWAGSGKLGDFLEESDLRKDNSDFVWLLGGAVGYESQNASNNAFPAPQTSTSANGLSNGDGPGFANYTLNADIFRGTLDYSAKWRGLSFLAAAYFQQVNANPGNTSSTSTSVSTGPFGASDASFFQHGYYGQVGYFLIPRRLEIDGRVGTLLTEGYPNAADFYSAGLNYYLYGQNLKIQSDVTYTPEAAYTSASSLLLQNTQDLSFRVQLQLKF